MRPLRLQKIYRLANNGTSQTFQSSQLSRANAQKAASKCSQLNFLGLFVSEFDDNVDYQADDITFQKRTLD